MTTGTEKNINSVVMKLGTLDQLDTLEPSLYVEFPSGRLKMEGKIVYPKNRYLTLNFSQSGKNVICQDIFDKIVTFPTVYWIGTKEENPEEKPLPIPSEITVVNDANQLSMILTARHVCSHLSS